MVEKNDFMIIITISCFNDLEGIFSGIMVRNEKAIFLIFHVQLFCFLPPPLFNFLIVWIYNILKIYPKQANN